MITGFPSPAQGYEGKQIDFNSYMIKHPSATVVMRIESSHYTHINRNSLVVYESEGHFVLGRVYNIKGETIITGAITHVIHTVKDI